MRAWAQYTVVHRGAAGAGATTAGGGTTENLNVRGAAVPPLRRLSTMENSAPGVSRSSTAGEFQTLARPGALNVMPSPGNTNSLRVAPAAIADGSIWLLRWFSW